MTALKTSTRDRRVGQALVAFGANWRLYLIEAALLGSFMVSACAFTALLEWPTSPVHRALASDLLRRALIGVAMGATAVVLIYSRWGRRSGAHMNPAVTLSFLWLGKIRGLDAAFYAIAQFLGAAIGVALSALTGGMLIRQPPVHYVVTLPGSSGVSFAWAGEFVISFAMMGMVLLVNRSPRLAPRTGWFAGALVALYITFEAPLSGMSLNPARSFGSALLAGDWSSIWIYFTAPLAGMLAAVEIQRLLVRNPHLLCPRLTHCPHTPGIFRCNCHDRGGIEPPTHNL